MDDNRCKTCLAVDPSVGIQKESKLYLHAVSWYLVGALRGGKGKNYWRLRIGKVVKIAEETRLNNSQDFALSFYLIGSSSNSELQSVIPIHTDPRCV